MAEYKDYYKILGVSKNATDAELKKAFKVAARKYHPDMHPDSKKAEMTEKFKDVNEAYEVLSDKQKRTIYDQVGSTDYQNHARGGAGASRSANQGGTRYYYSNGGANPFGNFNQGGNGFNFNGTGGFDANDFSDFFKNIFGGLGGFGGSRRKTKSYGGAQDPYGMYKRPQEEETNLNLDIESAYKGGLVKLSMGSGKTAQVKFPSKIADGSKIKLKGLGSNGGDLYVNIKVSGNDTFKLEGNDILYMANVMPWSAGLGDTISVPLPDSSSVKIKIPAGSRTGQKLKLSGKGLGKSGNFYVQIMINNPSYLTRKQKELFEQLKNS